MVLSPAEDGGYVLIALKRSVPSLFNNMPWGSPQVLPLTRQKANVAQLNTYELTEQWDVDTPADLTRWQAKLKR